MSVVWNIRDFAWHANTQRRCDIMNVLLRIVLVLVGAHSASASASELSANVVALSWVSLAHRMRIRVGLGSCMQSAYPALLRMLV